MGFLRAIASIWIASGLFGAAAFGGAHDPQPFGGPSTNVHDTALDETTSVILRRAAVAEPAGGVTLGEIAEVAGGDASSIARVVLIDEDELAASDRSYVVIERDLVENRLMGAGARLGAISLSGSRCVVRFGRSAPKAVQARVPRTSPEPEFVVGDEAVEGTVGAEVVRQLSEAHAVTPDAIRTLIRTEDAASWARPLTDGRTTVRRATSVRAGRVVFAVTVFDKSGGVLEQARLIVEAQVRRRVFVAAERLRRGRPVDRTLLVEADKWLSPGDADPIGVDENVADWRVERRVEEGDVLRDGDLAAPVLVERGDKARLYAHSGGFVLETWVRVAEDGAFGDLVECEIEGGGRTFLATVDGPGRVVVLLDDPG